MQMVRVHVVCADLFADRMLIGQTDASAFVNASLKTQKQLVFVVTDGDAFR